MARTSRSLRFVGAVALAGCGSASAAPNAPGDTPPPPPPRVAMTASPDSSGDAFRAFPPEPGAEPPFTPPRIEEARLSNGVRVLVVERHELPIVAVSIAADRGADQAKPGVGGFVGGMLFAGTKKRSALALSDDLDRLGASYGGWVDFDGGGVRAQFLTPKLADVMSILGDVLQNPAYDPAEIKRERSRRLTAVAQEKDQPARLLSNTVAGALYAAPHPYGSSLLGTEEQVDAVTRADLAAFHAETFAPKNLTIAFAGDVTRAQAVAEAERVFGKWGGKAREATVPGGAPPAATAFARVVIVDRPGATQSSVAVALPGVPRKSPDFDAITVMNTILGGQFSSRLNLNLREAHGYTYGARSGFDFRHGPGPFSAGGAIFRESTGAAVGEILAEIDRLRREPVGDEELADAKTNLIRQLPARFESAGETAATLAALSTYALPLDEFATRPARFGRVTKEDVRRVAQTYLEQDRLRVFVVGDAAVIREGLEKLGIGPVEVRAAPAKDAPGKGGKAGGKPASKAAATKPTR